MTPLFDRLDALPPLSPEEQQVLDSVRALARDEIAPRAAEYDRKSEFPRANIEARKAQTGIRGQITRAARHLL